MLRAGPMSATGVSSTRHHRATTNTGPTQNEGRQRCSARAPLRDALVSLGFGPARCITRLLPGIAQNLFAPGLKHGSVSAEQHARVADRRRRRRRGLRYGPPPQYLVRRKRRPRPKRETQASGSTTTPSRPYDVPAWAEGSIDGTTLHQPWVDGHAAHRRELLAASRCGRDRMQPRYSLFVRRVRSRIASCRQRQQSSIDTRRERVREG
jgi:hypothetical protein